MNADPKDTPGLAMTATAADNNKGTRSVILTEILRQRKGGGADHDAGDGPPCPDLQDLGTPDSRRFLARFSDRLAEVPSPQPTPWHLPRPASAVVRP
jgi:hypothetical protein